MRKPIIAANWKMNKTGADAQQFMQSFLAQSPTDQADIVICPPFLALPTVSNQLNQNKSKATSNIAVGAQNLYTEQSGAFTGEVSGDMIAAAGATYVIIGHSERRELLGETNAFINQKIQSAQASHLIPIVCIGESDAQREANQTFDVLKTQLVEGLSNIQLSQASNLVIAYEPIWAIGTGKVATPEQVQEVHQFIRQTLGQILGSELAAGIRIQYGGSVKPENIASIMSLPDVDGALVGGASLKPDSFFQLIEAGVAAATVGA